ncbi:MAG: hypothetical protein EON52_18495 [Actinomycetales bacterium]|nr:MAG: hypothetical protein EON52_18495 [Actinomycetales bacterium]
MHELSSTTSQRSASWLILIYQAPTHASQQRILQRLTGVGTSDLTVLGAASGPDAFVVAECAGPREQALIDQAVAEVEPAATLVYASAPTGPLVAMVRGDDVL